VVVAKTRVAMVVLEAIEINLPINIYDVVLLCDTSKCFWRSGVMTNDSFGLDHANREPPMANKIETKVLGSHTI
jgi:hypothetical protein